MKKKCVLTSHIRHNIFRHFKFYFSLYCTYICSVDPSVILRCTVLHILEYCIAETLFTTLKNNHHPSQQPMRSTSTFRLEQYASFKSTRICSRTPASVALYSFTIDHLSCVITGYTSLLTMSP